MNEYEQRDQGAIAGEIVTMKSAVADAQAAMIAVQVGDYPYRQQNREVFDAWLAAKHLRDRLEHQLDMLRKEQRYGWSQEALWSVYQHSGTLKGWQAEGRYFDPHDHSESVIIREMATGKQAIVYAVHYGGDTFVACNETSWNPLETGRFSPAEIAPTPA